MMLDQVTRSVPRACLLVGYGSQDDVALELCSSALEQHQGHEAHRHHVLHIDGAPTPDAAVVLIGGEGAVEPPLGIGGHHVQMPIEKERGLLSASRQASDQTG